MQQYVFNHAFNCERWLASNQWFSCHCLEENQLKWRYEVRQLCTQINSNGSKDKKYLVEVIGMQYHIRGISNASGHWWEI
jgi:hypothetical protein